MTMYEKNIKMILVFWIILKFEFYDYPQFVIFTKKGKKIKIFAYISFPSFLSPGMIGIFQPDH